MSEVDEVEGIEEIAEIEDTTSLTFNQAVRGITEFIEVAIHTILYVRQIYPADLFIRRKKYDTPVYQSRHPALNEYISGAVQAIGEELVQGNVDKVIVVIKDKNEVALERFLFAVYNMIAVESFSKDDSVQGAILPSVLGQYFRAFLVKLNMIEAQLAPICVAGDLSFTIVIELTDDKVPSASKHGDPPPWIPAFQQHGTPRQPDDSELHIIRAVETGIVNLSLSVQESQEKLRLLNAQKDGPKDVRDKPANSNPES